jgi:hypothetical protein
MREAHKSNMLWGQFYPDIQQDWMDSIWNLCRRHKRRKECHFQLFDKMMKLDKKYSNSNRDYIISLLIWLNGPSFQSYSWANNFFHKMREWVQIKWAISTLSDKSIFTQMLCKLLLQLQIVSRLAFLDSQFSKHIIGKLI